MTETKDLAKPSEIIPLPLDNHMIVLAKDPQEMQVSQERLGAWFEERTATAKIELADAETNLAQAKSRKWATTGWRRQVKLASDRVIFYEKCLAAIQAGYCIIPDFPTDVFAVRTSRKKPAKNSLTRTGWSPNPAPQRSDGSPLGAGEYVSPDANLLESRKQITRTNYEGKEIKETSITAWADTHAVPDFPMKAVPTQILDATGKAMALKFFDEIGVLPARRTQARAGDPIVTGRIVRREGTRDIGLTFLIKWWIDTRDL